MIPAYPLQWPTGWPRTASLDRRIGMFKMPAGKTRYLLSRELELLGAQDVVVSSNIMVRADGMPYARQPQVDDPGVVLYFMLDGAEVSIPCDRWSSVDANLRAIGMAIEAIRGMERWGTGQMVKAAFRGFAALPASASSGTPVRPHRAWWDVLQVSRDAPKDLVTVAYKLARRNAHPDMNGGSEELFNEVQQAYKEATS
jgi:hypothetical protein